MTKTHKLGARAYNSERLHEELTAALPGRCFGVSAARGDYYAVVADDLTPQEITTLETAAAAHNPAAQSINQTLRAGILAQANSAAGVLLTDLTAGQVRALLACMLWKDGAIDNSGKVRPLSEWV